MADKEFYLGRLFDLKNGKTTTQSVTYDPADLTTQPYYVIESGGQTFELPAFGE